MAHWIDPEFFLTFGLLFSLSDRGETSNSHMFALGLFHTHPKFLNPQLFLSRLKNFHVHAYPHSNRICPSTHIRHVSGLTLVPRTPLEILAIEHAS